MPPINVWRQLPERCRCLTLPLLLLRKGIEENDYQAVISNLQNTLEKPSIKMVPEIEMIKQEMIKIGFDGALMSGSGSCVFALTKSDEILDKGFKYFKGKYYFVRKTEILNQNQLVD